MIPTADLTTAWNLSSVVVDMGAGGDMATSIYDEICAAAEGTRRRLYEREQRCIG